MTQASPAEKELGRQVLAALEKGKQGVPEALRLVELGAEIEQPDKWGLTALLIASARNYQPLVRALLDRGADPNTADSCGRTALMQATTRCYTAVAHMLIDAGADITKTNKDGMTAGDIAIHRQNEGNARLLEEWSQAAARNRQEKFGKTAVESWADAGLPTQQGIVVRRALTLKHKVPHA